MSDDMTFEPAEGEPVPGGIGVGAADRATAAQHAEAFARTPPDAKTVGETPAVVVNNVAGDARAVREAEHRKLALALGVPIVEDGGIERFADGDRAVSVTFGPGRWKRLQPGAPLTFMVTPESLAEAAALSPPRPQDEPQRIEHARMIGSRLGLPVTSDLRLDEVHDGKRAVNAMGRPGAFRTVTSDEHGDRFRFEPDPLTGVGTGFAQKRDAPAAKEPVLFGRPSWPRNGREVGAWAAGLAQANPLMHVELPKEDLAGAVHALVDAGMTVEQYGTGGGGTLVMLEVRCRPDLGDSGRPRGSLTEILLRSIHVDAGDGPAPDLSRMPGSDMQA